MDGWRRYVYVAVIYPKPSWRSHTECGNMQGRIVGFQEMSFRQGGAKSGKKGVGFLLGNMQAAAPWKCAGSVITLCNSMTFLSLLMREILAVDKRAEQSNNNINKYMISDAQWYIEACKVSQAVLLWSGIEMDCLCTLLYIKYLRTQICSLVTTKLIFPESIPSPLV